MKNTRMGLFFLTFILFISNAFAGKTIQKIIYGQDDRLDIFEVQDSVHYQISQSTAAIISKYSLKKRGDRVFISGSTLKSTGVCSGERFAKQITAANCSAFLVAEDIMVTAGHCINARSCNSYSFVFDYDIKAGNNDEAKEVSVDDVYKCKTVLKSVLDRNSQNDYAVVKLDRPVRGRIPLKVRTEGKIKTGTDIVVIGHPTGLPTKVSAGAIVRDNSPRNYFVTNLDTFGGNSGSAVFDSKTGVVEGILVRGGVDYEYDTSRSCKRPKVCRESGCRGEDVTRITSADKLMELLRY